MKLSIFLLFAGACSITVIALAQFTATTPKNVDGNLRLLLTSQTPTAAGQTQSSAAVAEQRISRGMFDETGRVLVNTNRTVPPRPKGLAAIPGDQQVDVTWNAVSGVTGYNIYRDNLLIASPSSPSFVDFGLTDGQSYTYLVSAVNDDGEGVKSRPLAVTPQPPLGGAWPGPANTGVPSGTNLTVVNGDVEINTPDTVIDSQDIRGCVLVNAPGVIIRRSKINCPNYVTVLNNSASIYHGGYTGQGLLIEDSEISCLDGNGRPTNGTAVGDNNFITRRLNIHGCENGYDVDINASIIDNYIHDLFQSSAAHTDGIQSADGTNVTIDHNTIYSNNGTSSININALPDSPITTTNATVSNNLLAGGAATLYCPGPPSVNVQILNNHFLRIFYPNGGQYFPWTQCENVSQARRNIWDDTREPLHF